MARWFAPTTAVGVLILASAMGAAGVHPPQADTLSALLAEVRHIRLTIDRVATVSPRIQILLTQLQLQQGRVERLTNQVNGYRDSLARIIESINRNSDTLREFDGAIPGESDPQRRKQLERERAALKAQIDDQTAASQRLQATEAETAGRLQVEQLQLDELTRKLAELDRELATPR